MVITWDNERVGGQIPIHATMKDDDAAGAIECDGGQGHRLK